MLGIIVMVGSFSELARQVRSMVRQGAYVITDYVTKAHPERGIKKDDVKQALLTGTSWSIYPSSWKVSRSSRDEVTVTGGTEKIRRSGF